MITILSLILLCSSTDVVSTISTSESLAITKLPKNPVVHILLQYLDIPTGFTLILQQRSWYAHHYATLYDRQSLHYASEYFPFLTTVQKLRENNAPKQFCNGVEILDYSIHDPVIHLSDLPKLHYYSNFFRTVPNPAVFYSGMGVLYFSGMSPTNQPWALCTAPEQDRERNNASMKLFYSYRSDYEYSYDTDHSSANFDNASGKCLRMVYNPLTTELRQYSVEKEKWGRILMSRFLRIPALLVFTHTELETPAIHLELLCQWKCFHWWAADESTYVYWKKDRHTHGFEMRFDSKGILRDIRVGTPLGNYPAMSTRFSIQDTKTSTFVGQSIRMNRSDFNIIHAFYYPSFTIPWLYWVPISCRKKSGFGLFSFF